MEISIQLTGVHLLSCPWIYFIFKKRKKTAEKEVKKEEEEPEDEQFLWRHFDLPAAVSDILTRVSLEPH